MCDEMIKRLASCRLKRPNAERCSVLHAFVCMSDSGW